MTSGFLQDSKITQKSVTDRVVRNCKLTEIPRIDVQEEPVVRGALERLEHCRGPDAKGTGNITYFVGAKCQNCQKMKNLVILAQKYITSLNS